MSRVQTYIGKEHEVFTTAGKISLSGYSQHIIINFKLLTLNSVLNLAKDRLKLNHCICELCCYHVNKNNSGETNLTSSGPCWRNCSCNNKERSIQLNIKYIHVAYNIYSIQCLLHRLRNIT